jgi:arylsulfatase A-like enzyme
MEGDASACIRTTESFMALKLQGTSRPARDGKAAEKSADFNRFNEQKRPFLDLIIDFTFHARRRVDKPWADWVCGDAGCLSEPV